MPWTGAPPSCRTWPSSGLSAQRRAARRRPPRSGARGRRARSWRRFAASRGAFTLNSQPAPYGSSRAVLAVCASAVVHRDDRAVHRRQHRDRLALVADREGGLALRDRARRAAGSVHARRADELVGEVVDADRRRGRRPRAAPRCGPGCRWTPAGSWNQPGGGPRRARAGGARRAPRGGARRGGAATTASCALAALHVPPERDEQEQVADGEEVLERASPDRWTGIRGPWRPPSVLAAAKRGSSRRMGMRLTIQRKASTPMVTSVMETMTSIQCGTYRSADGSFQLKAMTETFRRLRAMPSTPMHAGDADEPSRCRSARRTRRGAPAGGRTRASRRGTSAP